MKKIALGISKYFILIFVVFVSLFPILWIIVSSFKTNADILNSPFTLPKSIDFGAYVEVFKRYSMGVYTFNSFIVAISATLISLFIFAMGAYVLAKYNFRGKNIFYILFTLTLLVPANTKAQPIFSLITKLNLYDTKMALVLVYISCGMAMSIFILRATFMTIPKELSESAEVEGAGFFKIFWAVNLPLAKSGLMTAGILMFLNNWNEYFFAMLLTSSPQNRTLPVALAFFNDSFNYNYTVMFAALTIAILPGILIYSVAQEQIQSSVASSGVKG